ncbi:regulator of telomere elongation helicase 1-like protein, partial [Dinothrombium tinctorium]
MHSFEVNGITIQFPFQPYDIQYEYIKNVIKVLKEEKIGLFESPTGTGKTLSLLCSTISYMYESK